MNKSLFIWASLQSFTHITSSHIHLVPFLNLTLSSRLTYRQATSSSYYFRCANMVMLAKERCKALYVEKEFILNQPTGESRLKI